MLQGPKKQGARSGDKRARRTGVCGLCVKLDSESPAPTSLDRGSVVVVKEGVHIGKIGRVVDVTECGDVKVEVGGEFVADRQVTSIELKISQIRVTQANTCPGKVKRNGGISQCTRHETDTTTTKKRKTSESK